MIPKTTAVVLFLVTAACGSGHMQAPDVSSYRQGLSDVSSAVESHRAASIGLTAADCATEKARYETQLQPMLDRMASMSSDMDACMREMGHGSSADMQATCQSMRTELDAHLATACNAGDIGGEATRHAAAMAGMIQHEMDSSSTMQRMMGGSMMSGSMMSGGSCRP